MEWFSISMMVCKAMSHLACVVKEWKGEVCCFLSCQHRADKAPNLHSRSEEHKTKEH